MYPTIVLFIYPLWNQITIPESVCFNPIEPVISICS